MKTVATPGWYDDYVLTVGSVGRDGPSSFSLAGPWVDVAAIAEDVVSLDPDGEGLIDRLATSGDESPISGTSYAAPVVSGIVALVRSRSPELTARQVMQRIEDTAHRPTAGWDPIVGHGTVDAMAAVSAGPGSVPGRRSNASQMTTIPRPGQPNRPQTSQRVLPRSVSPRPSQWWRCRRWRLGYADGPTLSRPTDAASMLSSGPRGS